jgi:hypothetical protein
MGFCIINHLVKILHCLGEVFLVQTVSSFVCLFSLSCCFTS